MQAASPPSPSTTTTTEPPSSQPNPPSAGGTGTGLAAEYELKRRYLGLLLPSQIIEICMNFDVHVPDFVKDSIWPPDLQAAISALQAQALPVSAPPPSSTDVSDDQAVQPDIPSLMDSLIPSQDASAAPVTSENSREPPKPPEPVASTSTSATAALPLNDAPSTVAPPQAADAPVQPATAYPAQPPAQPAYPHQPYGYHAAYPHTPYYSGAPSYPYLAHYGYPPPAHGYPPPMGYPPHPPAAPPPPAGSAYPAAPYGAEHATTTPDDMPSYEEMIAEALAESNDPEGLPPKALFTWMAARYPVQSNFRPSASQALQKAYKRGRLEKSTDGKYRLNAAWEGGNTSRRTTRRPQTQSQTPQPPTSSPFTHAPLHHGHHTPPAYPGYPGYPGYHGHPPYPPPAADPAAGKSAADPSGATTTAAPAPPTGDAPSDNNDAWEAAQTILRAINFAGLVPLESEPQNSNSQEISTGSRTELISANEPELTSVPQIVVEGSGTTHETAAGTLFDQRDTTAEPPRAELQAQLALLAAQLAAIAQDIDEVPPPVIDIPAEVPSVTAAPQEEEAEINFDEIEDDDDDDMDEVQIG